MKKKVENASMAASIQSFYKKPVKQEPAEESDDSLGEDFELWEY